MIELFHRQARHKPRLGRLHAAVALTVALMFLPAEPSPHGQTVTTTPQPGQPGGVTTVEVFDWRWAFTQGGLTIVVIVLVWSYRKDLTRWADDRVAAEQLVSEAKAATLDERIGFQQARVDEGIRYHRSLEAFLERMEETLRSNTTALAEHTTALARNTDSTHRLANAVDKLDERLERVEHRP